MTRLLFAVLMLLGAPGLAIAEPDTCFQSTVSNALGCMQCDPTPDGKRKICRETSGCNTVTTTTTCYRPDGSSYLWDGK